ncbi:MAG: ribulose-phosphate 3-epimerase [Lentisphaerae bacterium]|nr:MAG: ribulose-phosphate 3-epimerase [Lentisphaerota bacterium]
MSGKKLSLANLPWDSAIVAPSILAADTWILGDQITCCIDEAGTKILHIDIMDGHFVPNLSFGPGVVKSIRQHCDLFLDVHLMITHPGQYIQAFAQAGADHITVHIESEGDMAQLLTQIHELGCSAGLTLRPGTPVERLEPWLEHVQMVLVMTVEPGFGGQSFMADQMPKVKWLADMRRKRDLCFAIEVDGGVNAETAKICRQAGANVLVAGSSVFRATNGIGSAIRAMEN